MMVVMMMVTDYDLGGPCATNLCQTLIVGLQQGQGVRNWVEKVAIGAGLREFRAAGRRRLDHCHGCQSCGRSQQAG
jgi:hypothetical protein